MTTTRFTTDTLPETSQAFPEKMGLNPVTLRFIGNCAPLEPGFQRQYTENSISYIRTSLGLALALYAISGFRDMLMASEDNRHLVWLIRYGVVCPLMLLVISLTHNKTVQRWLQPILTSLFIVCGLGMVCFSVIAPDVRGNYYVGLILVLVFGYTFVRVQFVWATVGGCGIIIIYSIAMLALGTIPVRIFISDIFLLISTNIASMLSCYFMERFIRRDFFMTRLLMNERENVETVKQELEERVKLRTADLEQANRDLAAETIVRLRLADQLKQAEKMEAIGNMAAGVAHDLNNILSGLVTYPEFLLMTLAEDDPLRESILIINKSGEKAAAIVQDLLTLARRGVIQKTILNPNQLIREYLADPVFTTFQKHSHIRFRIDLAEDLLNVTASPIHLYKSVMNLVSNAVEAQLVPGQITIATENRSLDQALESYETIAPGDYVTITVKDTGIGISPEDLRQIFEPFFTKKRMGWSGTGLGMSVVWSTVKDINGYIDAQSCEGQGTAFTLYLPVSREAVPTAEARITIDDCRGTERILVVDDLADQREIAAAMLGKLGYTVDTVASGEAALSYLSEHTVDILILDMVMDPGIDGCETWRRVVEQFPGQRAIIASGFAESERAHEARRLGAGAYIKKPYTLEKIAIAVRRELDRDTLEPG